MNQKKKNSGSMATTTMSTELVWSPIFKGNLPGEKNLIKRKQNDQRTDKDTFLFQFC